MKCPHCGSQAAETAAECAGCGLVFAKWREREEREKARRAAEPAPAPPAPLAAADAPVFRGFSDPWLARAAALGLVAAWMLGLWLYLRVRYARGTPPDEVPAVLVRDPRTGDLKRLVIRSRPQPPPPPAAPRPPDPPARPPRED